MSSPRTPAAASGAGFGGAQPPSNRFASPRHTRSGSGSQARCADDAHCIRHASFPGSRALPADCRRVRGSGIHRAACHAKSSPIPPVFPRAPRLDVERLDLLRLQPVLHAGGDKLRAIVAAQVFGHSIAGYGYFHYRDDIDGPDGPRRMNGQALPGVFVQ